MEKTRIQDDLYQFVNAEWLETAEIPADKPTTGGFANLSLEVENLLIGDFLNYMALQHGMFLPGMGDDVKKK